MTYDAQELAHESTPQTETSPLNVGSSTSDLPHYETKAGSSEFIMHEAQSDCGDKTLKEPSGVKHEQSKELIEMTVNDSEDISIDDVIDTEVIEKLEDKLIDNVDACSSTKTDDDPISNIAAVSKRHVMLHSSSF